MATPSLLTQYLLLILLLFLRTASTAPVQIVLDHYDDKDLNKILRFDDLPTTHGSGNLSHYSHLTFSSFTLINAATAASTGLISLQDSNCAASSPNALVASRHANPTLWPRMVLDPHTAAAAHISPFFNFVGLNRKPMDYTPIYTTVFVNAYGIVDGKEVRTHYSLASTFLTEGYQPSFPLNITQFFPTWGKNVNMVEIYAQTQSGEDWDFCIDDLLVEFLPEVDEESAGASDYDIPPAQMHVSIGVDF